MQKGNRCAFIAYEAKYPTIASFVSLSALSIDSTSWSTKRGSTELPSLVSTSAEGNVCRQTIPDFYQSGYRCITGIFDLFLESLQQAGDCICPADGADTVKDRFFQEVFSGQWRNHIHRNRLADPAKSLEDRKPEPEIVFCQGLDQVRNRLGIADLARDSPPPQRSHSDQGHQVP